jgi:hypothetical protein
VRRQATVGDDERAAHTGIAQVRGHLMARTGAKDDGAGKGKTREGHGHS